LPTSDRKKRERQERRNAILDAAELLVEKQGLESIRMDDIAAQADVSKGTLYLYFKNKVEIALALHNRGVRVLHQELSGEMVKEGSGLQLLQRMNHSFLRFAREHPHFFKSVVYIESIGLQAIKELKETETMNEIQQLDQSLFNYVRRAVQIGIQDGSIDSSFDPNQISFQIMAATRGLLQQIIFRDQGLLMTAGQEFNDISFEQLLEDYFILLSRSLEPR
jgi:AcrR family transcriptional regulator